MDVTRYRRGVVRTFKVAEGDGPSDEVMVEASLGETDGTTGGGVAIT